MSYLEEVKIFYQKTGRHAYFMGKPQVNAVEFSMDFGAISSAVERIQLPFT